MGGRLYPNHMAALYKASRKETPTTVIDRPVNLGWANEELYLAAHPSYAAGKTINALRRRGREYPPDLTARLTATAGAEADCVDWALVRKTARWYRIAGKGDPPPARTQGQKSTRLVWRLARPSNPFSTFTVDFWLTLGTTKGILT